MDTTYKPLARMTKEKGKTQNINIKNITIDTIGIQRKLREYNEQLKTQTGQLRKVRSHIVLHFCKSPAQQNTAGFSYLLLY